MKKIKSLIMVIAIIIMATVISGCSDGTSSKNDPLVGTWLHQVQAPVSAKRIDELVITKEDGKYLMQYFIWKYQREAAIDKKGKFVYTPDNKLMVNLKLNRKTQFQNKHLMEKQGDSYIVKIPLNKITITPNNGKLDVIGIDVSGKVSFERKENKKFKTMINEHKEDFIKKQKLVPEKYSVQIDNSILDKK